jgi:hypothetical protein
MTESAIAGGYCAVCRGCSWWRWAETWQLANTHARVHHLHHEQVNK